MKQGTSENLIEKNWDYSLQAEFYEFRPNYSAEAIDLLIRHVGARSENDYRVADIGAGTGNLSILLLSRGLNVIAIEPNDEMRKLGIRRTQKNSGIQWIKANGVNTTLPAGSIDWVTFGSSFNVMDRGEALKETHRILKPGAYFTCMWNHRNLNDPIQKIAEDIIVEFIPGYDRGVRREDQRPFLEQKRDLFTNIFYLEFDFEFKQSIDTYIKAWRSVRNKYWDLSTDSGEELFLRITNRMREKMPSVFSIMYTTRAWTLRKAA